MKKLLAFILCLFCILNVAHGESSATPTDLEEIYEIFEDDDYGYIEHFDRQVFLDFLKEPTYYGEEVTLVAILVNFLPTDIYTFEWEYSKDAEVWYIIQNEHEQTYTFIIDRLNCAYWWRVKVTLQEESL